jgi:hypothetical protein
MNRCSSLANVAPGRWRSLQGLGTLRLDVTRTAYERLSRAMEGWAFYVAEDVRDNQRLQKDLDFRATVKQAAVIRQQLHVDILRRAAEALSDDGYQFKHPSRVLLPPVPDLDDALQVLAAEGIWLPMSVQGFLHVCGGADFTGTHAGWRDPLDDGPSVHPEQLFLSDPLVVQLDLDEVLFDKTDDGPQLVQFAPDLGHKAGLSGGGPYCFDASRLHADAIVLDERHCETFMAHIGRAAIWCGLPGFEIRGRLPGGRTERLRQSLW